MDIVAIWLVALGICLTLGVLVALANRYSRGRRQRLRKVPVTDREKCEALEMTLRGAVFCVLGLLFSPLVIFGVEPLYYGLRKLGLAYMGVGLLEDPRDGSV